MSVRIKQAGDTVIEVLICMAIIGATLSISYGIARRSLFGIREAEERGQFTQIAQQQLERLKDYLKLNPLVQTGYPGQAGVSNSILGSGFHVGFCFYYNSSHNLTINYISTPTDPTCAVNKGGQFYCELATSNCSSLSCPSPPLPSNCPPDAAGYTYRAGVGYPPELENRNNPGTGVADQFYASSGIYQVAGGSTNSQGFDVVVIPYRIHQ